MTGDLDLRPMLESDLREVLALERECFSDPWTRGMFLSELQQETSYFFIGQTTAQIVAYGGICFVVDECHLINLAVRPDARRRKLGLRCALHLIDVALARGARRMTLEVRAHNAAAIALYEKCGFIGVALRKNYYATTGEDALIMWINDLASPTQEARLAALRAEVAG